jgi:hypothetical protein
MAYLPAFVFCCNKAYPQYHVKLFLRDPCPYDLKGWRLNCETVPFFHGFPRYEYLSIALRFAIPKEQFADFDSVYTTDIDMMIMFEPRDIEYFHEMEMIGTGLCYSNSLRNPNHYAGSVSLSGLHYASRQWYEMTDECAGTYRGLMERGLIGLYREWDGVMLYRIVKETGQKLPGKYQLAKRHHGIHLGNFRLFGDDKQKLDIRIPSEFRNQWRQCQANKTFRDIVETCRTDNPEMDMQVRMMDDLSMGRL